MSGDLIGFSAAFLTTASFVPQAWLTFKTRDVSGISLGMYSAFTLGVALWLVYGLSLGAWPVVVAMRTTVSRFAVTSSRSFAPPFSRVKDFPTSVAGTSCQR